MFIYNLHIKSNINLSNMSIFFQAFLIKAENKLFTYYKNV